jgi:hypothetical protein
MLIIFCTETGGLAVTYGLSLNMLQGWAIAVLCSLENRMISVERMLQYTIIVTPLVLRACLAPELRTEQKLLQRVTRI